MRTGIVLFTFILQAHAETSKTDAQDSVSMNQLANKVLEKLVIELSDRMLGSQRLDENLDNTVLGKPAVAASRGVMMVPMMMRPPTMMRAGPPSTMNAPKNAPPQGANVPPSRRKEPFKGPNKELISGVAEEHQDLAESMMKPGVMEAMAKASEALAGEGKDEELPYTISFFVNGGNLGDDGKLGPANMKYMEHRVQSALKNFEKNIEDVAVRLSIEGSDPKLFRMEATVKLNHVNSKGKVIISNSNHAEHSFVEAVDHLHDLLKSEMRKKKEKWLSKKIHARKTGEEMADDDQGNDLDIVADDDDAVSKP